MFRPGFEFAPDYRLDLFLGRGQFGQVWRTSAPGGVLMAVKFVDLGDGQWQKEYEGIQRIKQIRHPNLMPITAIWLLGADGKLLVESTSQDPDAGTIDGIVVDTMQMETPTGQPDWLSRHQGRGKARWLAVAMTLGGKSLLQRMEECQQQGHDGIPPKELLGLMDESAKGLDFLNSQTHEFGADLGTLQHCDVKPANIVLVGSSAVVCDFGLARIMSRDQVTASRIAGTPAYMAPETIGGKPARTSDQYSLAVTYYHLRTGVLPLSDNSLWEVLDAHRLGKLNFDRIDEAEREVLRRATSLDWASRYESSGELVEALREAWRSTQRPALQLPPSLNRVGDATLPAWKRPAVIGSAVGVALLALLLLGQTFGGKETPANGDGDGDVTGVTKSAGLGDPESGDRGNQADSSLAGNPGEPSDTQVTANLIWNPEGWQTLLERGGSDPAAVATEFVGWIETFPGLASPFPIGLSGHAQDLEQAFWATTAASDNPDAGSVLLTRSLDPHVVRFPLDQLTRLAHASSSTHAGQGSSAAGESKTSDAVDGNGQVGMRMPPHEPFTSAMTLSPDSRFVATGGLDGRVRVLPIDAEPAAAAGDNRSLELGDFDIDQILFHPTQDYLLVSDGAGGIHLVKSPGDAGFAAATEVRSILLPFPVIRMAADRWGETLVLLADDGRLHTISWRDCERFLLSGMPPEPKAFSTPGSAIRSFVVHEIRAGENVVLAFDEAGVWSEYALAGGELLGRAPLLDGPVLASDARLTPDGWAVFAGGDYGALTFKPPGMTAVIPLIAHRDAVSDIAISPDGRSVVSVSRDGWAALRKLDDLPNFLPFRDLAEGPLTLVRWSPSGRWIVTGGYGGRLTFWDARHLGLLLRRFPMTQLPTPDAPPETSPADDPTSPEKPTGASLSATAFPPLRS